MKSIFMLLATCFFIAQPTYAQPTSNKMTKIVSRDTSPDTPRSSFRAKPKTLYRIGDTYARVEEELDPALNMHGLIIVSEPKIWMINLLDRTGQLIIDPGPTYVFRAPIIPPDSPNQESPLRGFEFGQEYEFLRDNNATLTKEILQGKTYDKLYLKKDGISISLLSHTGEDRPYRVIIFKGKQLALQVDYDYYKRDLEPQMFLFEPPKGIQIFEAKQL
jgi:hypothetical protein